MCRGTRPAGSRRSWRHSPTRPTTPSTCWSRWSAPASRCAALTIETLAAAPLVSASSLGAGLGMAVKNAAALLDEFHQAGISVEVTRRSKRRLFGLAGLAPLREVVRAPDRPAPTRGRGRPRLEHGDNPADHVV